MSQRVISLGGGRGRGSVYVRSNLHRVEILCTAAKDAKCRYCCKSPKLLGDNFLAIRRSDPRPPIFTVSITLPRSPVSLSSGDEVSHIFTRKSRLKPGEFLITSAKGLLQQNLPGADSCTAAKQRAYWTALVPPTIRGSRIVNVEPRHGSLSTVMSPPII